MKTIKIAPSADEVQVKENGHLFEVEFNDLLTQFIIKDGNTLNEACWDVMRLHICQAIALSSRPHHVARLLEGIETTDGKPLGDVVVFSRIRDRWTPLFKGGKYVSVEPVMR